MVAIRREFFVPHYNDFFPNGDFEVRSKARDKWTKAENVHQTDYITNTLSKRSRLRSDNKVLTEDVPVPPGRGLNCVNFTWEIKKWGWDAFQQNINIWDGGACVSVVVVERGCLRFGLLLEILSQSTSACHPSAGGARWCSYVCRLQKVCVIVLSGFRQWASRGVSRAVSSSCSHDEPRNEGWSAELGQMEKHHIFVSFFFSISNGYGLCFFSFSGSLSRLLFCWLQRFRFILEAAFSSFFFGSFVGLGQILIFQPNATSIIGKAERLVNGTRIISTKSTLWLCLSIVWGNIFCLLAGPM